MGDKKSRAEKAKFKSEATQFKEKSHLASKFVARHARVFPSVSPHHLSGKDNVKDFLKKNFNLIVRLVISPVEELASTMENLSALL